MGCSCIALVGGKLTRFDLSSPKPKAQGKRKKRQRGKKGNDRGAPDKEASRQGEKSKIKKKESWALSCRGVRQPLRRRRGPPDQSGTDDAGEATTTIS